MPSFSVRKKEDIQVIYCALRMARKFMRDGEQVKYLGSVPKHMRESNKRLYNSICKLLRKVADRMEDQEIEKTFK